MSPELDPIVDTDFLLNSLFIYMNSILAIILIVLNIKNILSFTIQAEFKHIKSELNKLKMSLQTADSNIQSHSDLKDTNYIYKFQVSTECESNLDCSYCFVSKYLDRPDLPFIKSASNTSQFEQISDNQFILTPLGINFFGNIIAPVMKLDITRHDEESVKVIEMNSYSTIIKGTKIAESLNDHFHMNSSSKLLLRPHSESSYKCVLKSYLSLYVYISRPLSTPAKTPTPTPTVIPSKIVQSAGSFLLQNYINSAVPAYLRDMIVDISTLYMRTESL